MYRLLVIQFIRNKMSVAAILLLLSIGMISLWGGKRFLAGQQSAIAETAAYQQQHIDRLVQYENKEMGLLLYYLKFAYINPTNKLAGLSIGQKDINSSIQSPTIRTLEAQKYDTDIRNPYQLMYGHFDMSFVIVYLFPLVIIGLCFSLYSDEKERGIWPLVQTQYADTRKYLLLKLSVPYLFVMGTLLILYISAAIILALPFQQSFFKYILCNTLYIHFWFALVLLVVSFYKSSSVNALCLLGLWLLLTLLLPAAVNNYITRIYPVPESLSTMLKQRDGYHKKWDITKDSTLELFTNAYPQYKDYKWKTQGFDWLWYYAMQHLGDVEASYDRDLLMKKLKQREKVSRQFSWLAPTLYTQSYNTGLAQTDLNNQLHFLDSTTRFHEKLRHYFYPKIFTDAPVLKENWSRFKPVYCIIKNNTSWVQSSFTLLYFLMLLAMAFFRLKR